MVLLRFALSPDVKRFIPKALTQSSSREGFQTLVKQREGMVGNPKGLFFLMSWRPPRESGRKGNSLIDTLVLTLAGVISSRSFKVEQKLSRGAKRVGANEAIVQVSPTLSPLLLSHFASGSGRSWKCTAIGFVPLPPSLSHGARSPLVVHNPRPFQPAFGSSMRPSKPLV